MKILLVDDSPPAREPVELQLHILGHEVVTADDGEQALAQRSSGPFDLVITDIRMPKMDGLELLRRLKAQETELDVIMITGYGDMDSSLEALRHGACNYLMKPVSLEELTLAVQTVEKRQALTRLLKEQEAKLEQARKMADLGLVAAGVAHEINNPNTFIRGNLQTLRKFWEVLEPFIKQAAASGLPVPDKLDFILEELPKTLSAMLTGTDRIRRIVDSTVAFTRPQGDDNLKAVDLNDCIHQVLNGLGPAGAGVNIVSRLEPGLPRVRATEDALGEVISELIRNSLRAVS
ncbi:MAG: response regulator, partial [Thermodesulfobacteriota bacterium]